MKKTEPYLDKNITDPEEISDLIMHSESLVGWLRQQLAIATAGIAVLFGFSEHLAQSSISAYLIACSAISWGVTVICALIAYRESISLQSNLTYMARHENKVSDIVEKIAKHINDGNIDDVAAALVEDIRQKIKDGEIESAKAQTRILSKNNSVWAWRDNVEKKKVIRTVNIVFRSADVATVSFFTGVVFLILSLIYRIT